jgi:CheY-like chemotaxis protein
VPDDRDVLVVEDDPVLGALLVDVLEAAGHRARLAQSSATALEAIEAAIPDVLCLDIDLPDGTGWGLLDQLADRGISPDRVVVATAGMAASRSRHRPGTFLLPKPFPLDSLLRLVSGAEPQEI